MKHRLRMGLAIILLLGLVACGATGRDYDTTHLADIQNNVTTKDQVKQWFGDPYQVGQSDNLLMWTYQFDGYNSMNKDESKELVLLFDDSGIVKAYRYASNMNH